MAKVFLKNATKIFGKTVVAVNNLTMQIPENELVCLLGPSGCGKTTTMRIIAGLETPTSGRVYINDQDVTDLPPKKRNISMVFQLPAVYETLTAYENIAFPLRCQNQPREKIKKRVGELVELFEILKEDLERKAIRLAVSDRQRISLAHAFAIPRNVYLLDEPLSNLDPKSRTDLRIKIKQIQKRIGETLIYVTHDQSEALTLADRIAVMHEGKLLQYDVAENVYSNPTNTFVGWFLGNPGMNFVDCVYIRRDGKRLLDAGSFKYEIGDIKELDEDRELMLGIRPENIDVSQTKKEGWIPCECTYTEVIGSRLLLHLQIGDIVVKAKVGADLPASESKRVWMNFPSEYVRLFDRKTKNTIS